MTPTMTPETEALIARVRELDAKATAGKWSVRKDYFDRSEPSKYAAYEVFPHTNGLKKPEDGCGEWTALATCKSYEPKNKQNADLIAFYRTAAPRLATALEAEAARAEFWKTALDAEYARRIDAEKRADAAEAKLKVARDILAVAYKAGKIAQIPSAHYLLEAMESALTQLEP